MPNWQHQAASILFWVPPGYRPAHPVLLEVPGHAEGNWEGATGASAFRLRITPDGAVRYRALGDVGRPPGPTSAIPVTWTTAEAWEEAEAALPDGADVCTRNPAVQTAVLAALARGEAGERTCASVTWPELAALEALELEMGIGFPPLRRGDLAGLTGLLTLSVEAPVILFPAWPTDLLALLPGLVSLNLELFDVDLPLRLLLHDPFRAFLYHGYREARTLQVPRSLSPALQGERLAALLAHAPELQQLSLRSRHHIALPSNLLVHQPYLHGLTLAVAGNSLPDRFLAHNPGLKLLILDNRGLYAPPADLLHYAPDLHTLQVTFARYFKYNMWLRTDLPAD